MRFRRGFRRKIMWVMFLWISFCIVACGGQQGKPNAKGPETTPLAKSYRNILCYKVKCTPEIQKDYPDAATDLQHSAIVALQMKNTFNKVDMLKPGQSAGDDTLLIKADITDLRIVSTTARVLGGVFVGSSGIKVDLQLIDGATNTVVREEKMDSHNNAWAASYTGGSSDKSLPSDMGKIIAEYVAASMPKN